MNIKHTLCIICCCLTMHKGVSAKKPVPKKTSSVHIIHSSPGAGFCYEMIKALNHLVWCKKRKMNAYVYWDEKSPYYLPGTFNTDNVWEYYFYPLCDIPLKHIQHIVKKKARKNFQYNPTHASDQLKRSNWLPNREGRLRAKEILDTQIRLKPHVSQKIESFYTQYMAGKKTIGIHLRGTDKYKERTPVDPLIMLHEANKYAAPGWQFFIATDELKLLKLAQQKLHGPVICYDCFRSEDDRPIHLRTTRYVYNKAQVGEDMLVEAHLLSRCNLFIHTPTNVAGFVVCLNPQLKNIIITADGVH